MAEMLQGALRPGSWIRQDELARRLGVSKIPVREALQRLSAIGLIRFETNRGATVPELSADEAEENYELRRAVEPKLLRRAIPHLTIVDLAEAELALGPAAGSGSASNKPSPPSNATPPSSITESNWAFHRALYRAAGWQRGLAMTEILHAAVAPYVLLYTEGLGGARHSEAEHRAMLDACRAGAADTAVDLLDQHLANAADALTRFLRSE
jgi:DNA-binding GntR family transcriptional regulator